MTHRQEPETATELHDRETPENAVGGPLSAPHNENDTQDVEAPEKAADGRTGPRAMEQPATNDRLDELRTEYAQTGRVTSDGAVWLIPQVVVLREQVKRLSVERAGGQPPLEQAARPPAPDPSTGGA